MAYPKIATLLRQANVAWVRMDVNWGATIGHDDDARDTANLHWRALGCGVDRATSRGMNVLGNLAYTPIWAIHRASVVSVIDSGRLLRFTPDDIEDWKRFVQAAVNTFPEIHYWSIWNEPNTTGTFYGDNPGDSAAAGDYLRIAAYNRLVAAAAPIIHAAGGKVVGLELAAGNDPKLRANDWLRGVLGAGGQGQNIDVVAVHLYTSSGTDARDYMYDLVQQSGVGGWHWPVWLTEVGLIGCNDHPIEADRVTLGYCVGDNHSYIDDGAQANHLAAVMSGMQSASPSSWWQKTFYWHSHAEVQRNNVGVDYGILTDAHTGSPFGLFAFGAYVHAAGPLRVDGPTFTAAGPVTLTAVPGVQSPQEPYYFVWDYRWCSRGDGPDDCTYDWYRYDEGSDLRTEDVYVGSDDYNLQFRVSQYSPDRRTSFATVWHVVTGPAPCQDGDCTRIPGAGGPGGGSPSGSRAGTSGVGALGMRAARVSASVGTAAESRAFPDSAAPVRPPAASGDPASLSYARTYGAAGVRHWQQRQAQVTHPGPEALP